MSDQIKTFALHDIAPLVAIFVAQQKIDVTEDEFRRLCKHLQGYQWPGNIRQLFKVLQSWVLTAQCQGKRPSVDYFPFIADSFSGQMVASESTVGHDHSEKILGIIRQALLSDFNMDSIMDSVEKTLILHAISQTESIGDAARFLQLSRSGLDSRRRRLGLV